jgi:hypothetical protein
MVSRHGDGPSGDEYKSYYYGNWEITLMKTLNLDDMMKYENNDKGMVAWSYFVNDTNSCKQSKNYLGFVDGISNCKQIKD